MDWDTVLGWSKELRSVSARLYNLSEAMRLQPKSSAEEPPASPWQQSDGPVEVQEPIRESVTDSLGELRKKVRGLGWTARHLEDHIRVHGQRLTRLEQDNKAMWRQLQPTEQGARPPSVTCPNCLEDFPVGPNPSGEPWHESPFVSPGEGGTQTPTTSAGNMEGQCS